MGEVARKPPKFTLGQGECVAVLLPLPECVKNLAVVLYVPLTDGLDDYLHARPLACLLNLGKGVRERIQRVIVKLRVVLQRERGRGSEACRGRDRRTRGNEEIVVARLLKEGRLGEDGEELLLEEGAFTRRHRCV